MRELSNTTRPNQPDEIIVLLGNPWVGKSAICNAIFQKNVFKSGVISSSGVTKQEQTYLYENKLYIDTPGLYDVDPVKQNQAVKEIEKALKHNGNYKIIFVATLKAGTIESADLVTINAICDTIKTNFRYGIIFNKIPDNTNDQLERKGLNQYFITLHKRPGAAVILTREDELEDQEDKYFQMNSKNMIKLFNFLNVLHSYKIEEKDIEKIDVIDFQGDINLMQEKYKKTLAKGKMSS